MLLVAGFSRYASHLEATRTVCYEGRIAEGFLQNVPVAAAALMYRVREAIENARRASVNSGHVAGPTCGLLSQDAKSNRAAGRQLVDPAMLIFVCLRYDHRRSCLLHYAVPAQSYKLSGLARLSAAAETDVSMTIMKASASGLIGVGFPARSLVNLASQTVSQPSESGVR